MNTPTPDKLESIGVERRFALDVASVTEGIRPRGLLHVPETVRLPLEGVLLDLGLSVEASRTLFQSADPLTRENLLSEAPQSNSSVWSEIWFAHKSALPVEPEKLFNEPGKHLGYPLCCRNALNARDSLSGAYQKYLTGGTIRDWRLNRLSTLFCPFVLTPDFFPCSLDCPLAIEFVEPFVSLSNSIFRKEEANLATKFMKSIMTIVGSDLVCWPDWRIRDGRLYLDSSTAKKEQLAQVCVEVKPVSNEGAGLLLFRHIAELGSIGSRCQAVVQREEEQDLLITLSLA